MIYIAVLVFYFILLLFSRREETVRYAAQETKLPGVFLRMAAWIQKTAQARKGAGSRKRNRRIEEELRILYPGKAEDQSLMYRRDKLALTLMILFAGTVLSLGMRVGSRQKQQAVSVVKREKFGLEQTITLTAQLGDGQREETVTLNVSGREYTEEEVMAYMEQVRSLLPTAILGENADVDHVTAPLNLFRSIDDNPVTIVWASSDYGLMDSKGNIRALEIAEEGELCMLTARLSCQGYEEEETFYIRICQGEKTEEELLYEELEQVIRQQEEADRTAWEVVLPKEVAGNRVVWRRQEKDNSVIIAFLTLALAVGVCIAKDRDLHQKIQKRKDRLLLEYPGFVSRIVLLMGAGMTIRGAMYKMAQDQKKKTIYQEVAYTCNELDSGISETKAYYNLGRRCGEPHYIRLCMLLSQNLRKGTAELTALLKKESADAFEERKRNARRLGEEAGTKLLLPMAVMLVIVMTIIMVPAFMSFSS